MTTGTTLRARLDAGDTLYAAWIGTPSPAVGEAIAESGWDAVVVDMQHSAIDFESMAGMLAAIQGAGTPGLVRTPLGDPGAIGRVLDAGAQGVICPMINSEADAQWLGSAAKFPPLGERSWGPARAMRAFGLDRASYLTAANKLCLTWPMIETRAALDALDEILAPPGIDALFVGPNDLCVSLTGAKAIDPSVEDVMTALEQIVKKAREHSVIPGIYANTPELAKRYAEMGFRLIALGNEAKYIQAGSAALLKQMECPV